MMNKKFNARTLVITGVMAALSVILYFFEFPIIPGFSYLNVDLSDIPAAVAGIFFGPAWAVAVELVKNLIHLMLKGLGTTMGYGNLMNFIVGTALVLPLSIVMRSMLKKGANVYISVLLSGLSGLVSMAVIGVAGNYLIAPAFFFNFMNITLSGSALWGAIAGATILNVIKPVIVTVSLLPVMRFGKKYSDITENITENDRQKT
jgi:riboflavin transporter FmnP